MIARRPRRPQRSGMMAVASWRASPRALTFGQVAEPWRPRLRGEELPGHHLFMDTARLCRGLASVHEPSHISDAVTCMTLGGLWYATYYFLITVSLSHASKYSNVIDVILAFSISRHMLMTAGSGFAGALRAGDHEGT